MVEKIITVVSAFVITTISTLGYGGVVLMMAVESACIPLPSEVIMPFSGFLVASGRFDLQMVAIMGAIGCLLGSYVAYYVGAHGGRRFIRLCGRSVKSSPLIFIALTQSSRYCWLWERPLSSIIE